MSDDDVQSAAAKTGLPVVAFRRDLNNRLCAA
jgi:hypothetical protein